MKKSDPDKSIVKNSQEGNDLSNSPLKAMGITSPGEIYQYTLWEEDGQDVLRVYYKRAKGSVLPATKKYKFGRGEHTIVTDSGAPEYAKEKRFSPILQSAIAELDKIVKRADDISEKKQVILDEIVQMEKFVHSKVKELQAQIDEL